MRDDAGAGSGLLVKIANGRTMRLSSHPTVDCGFSLFLKVFGSRSSRIVLVIFCEILQMFYGTGVGPFVLIRFRLP